MFGIFRLFLSLGVPTDSGNHCGFTALHLAVENRNEEAVFLLLKNKATPNAFGNAPDHHFTPLHLAKTKDIVYTLLQFGADPYQVSQTVLTKKRTILQRFLSVQSKTAHGLFDDAICSNGHAIDAKELLVIMDYKLS